MVCTGDNCTLRGVQQSWQGATGGIGGISVAHFESTLSFILEHVVDTGLRGKGRVVAQAR